jgi:hypothetical protein
MPRVPSRSWDRSVASGGRTRAESGPSRPTGVERRGFTPEQQPAGSRSGHARGLTGASQSRRIESCHVVPRRVPPCRVVSCRVVSDRVASPRVPVARSPRPVVRVDTTIRSHIGGVSFERAATPARSVVGPAVLPPTSGREPGALRRAPCHERPAVGPDSGSSGPCPGFRAPDAHCHERALGSGLTGTGSSAASTAPPDPADVRDDVGPGGRSAAGGVRSGRGRRPRRGRTRDPRRGPRN